MTSHDYFSFLSAHGDVALDAIRTAAKQALAAHNANDSGPPAFTESEKVAVVTAILTELRQQDALGLEAIIKLTEEFFAEESDLDASDKVWWQEQGAAVPEFELYYNDIIALLPASAPSAQSYLDVWQNDKKTDLEQRISRLSQDLRIASEDDIAGDVGVIAEELQFCQRCAEDCGLLLSGEFIKIVHDICQLAIGHGVHLTDGELDHFEHSLLRCIDIIWEIRTFVANGGDERQYWHNPVSRQNFLAVRDKLATLSEVLAAAA